MQGKNGKCEWWILLNHFSSHTVYAIPVKLLFKMSVLTVIYNEKAEKADLHYN